MTSIGLFRRILPSESYLFEAIAVPLNYSDACTFTSDEDFEVDWGDGDFIAYAAGSASVVPTDTINIRSNNAVTICRFVSDTYSSINITKSTTLTSASLMCYALSNLTSFSIDDSSNITSFSNAFRGTSSMTTFPVIDLSSALNLSRAFQNSAIVDFPTLSYPLVTDFSYAWYQSTGSTFGNLIAPSATNLSYTFYSSSLVEVGDVSLAEAANVRFMFRRANNLRCIKSITTTSTMTNRTRMFESTGVLKYPNPDDVVDLIYSAGDVYTNPSPEDCAAFTYGGTLWDGELNNLGSGFYIYRLNKSGTTVPGFEADGPHCTVKFGHTDTIINALGMTDNGSGNWSKTVGTNVTLAADWIGGGWSYYLYGQTSGNVAEIESLGIYAVNDQLISIHVNP
jgi:hypothetical protein